MLFLGGSVLIKLLLQHFAKKRDIKMVNDVAKEVGIDREEFGMYIHEIKQLLGMKPKDNFSYENLVNYAWDLYYEQEGGR
jgi:hypothetical protein